MASKVIAWNLVETIGVGLPNPRSVTRMPIPSDLSPEQLARIEAAIDRINAELALKGEAAGYLV